MKKSIFLSILLSLSLHMTAQNWQPQGDRIKTPWADQVNPQQPLNAYPRPLLTRSEWQNLNGLWQYAIAGENDLMPEQFDGQILVPFPIESSLSGVMKSVNQGDVLWYKRTFSVPSAWDGKDVLLHFGAVDHEATVYVNDRQVDHFHCGDFLDLHDYARPPKLFLNDTTRPVVLGEYGGLGRHIPGHRWYEADATTYVNYGDEKAVTDSYVEQGEAVLRMARGITLDDGTPAAFSAAVYTQTTDVETEVNGLMTYDRRVMKLDERRIRDINQRICNALKSAK